MQTGNSVLSERWLAKNVKEGQSVLLIHDGNSKAIFPSIKVPKVKLFVPINTGEYKQICKEFDQKRSSKAVYLSKTCFPRPVIFPASTKEPLEDLIRKFDWIVFTNNKYENELTSSEIAWIGNIKPTLKIYKPKFKQRLSYPKSGNFPHGDWGVWQNIQIYSRK